MNRTSQNPTPFIDGYLELINASNIKPQKLTSVLKSYGYRTAAIKTSTNTSEYLNILDGVEFSVENSSIEYIADHIKSIKTISHDSIDAYFIDIDCLHRGHRFFKEDNIDWKIDTLDWLNPSQTKKNRLLGINDTTFDELSREISILKKTDLVLGSILEIADDKDTILILRQWFAEFQKQ